MHLGFHSARNRLQLLTELLGFFVMFFDLFDVSKKFRALFRDILVGHHQIGNHQNIAHGQRVLANGFGQRQNISNHQRRSGQRFAHSGLAALDALGQLDLALTREQRHGAHLAQIHAHGIVGLVAEILRQFLISELFALLDFFSNSSFGSSRISTPAPSSSVRRSSSCRGPA